MIANGKYMKDGVEKTNWDKVGIIGVSQSGKEYCLLDPTISLSGFQREQGKDMLMCSIFDDANRQSNNSQPNQGYQQQPQQQYQQQPPTYYENAQGRPTPPPSQVSQPQQPIDDSDIPF